MSVSDADQTGSEGDWVWKQQHLWFAVSDLNAENYLSKEDKGDIRWAPALTWWLGLFPEVIKALKAPWVLQSQLVIKVPEQQGHEDDEESNGSQKPQHLRRDWNTEGRVQAACRKRNHFFKFASKSWFVFVFVLISITASV